MKTFALFFIFALICATSFAKYYQPNIFAGHQRGLDQQPEPADIFKALGDFFNKLSSANSG